jgi:anti-sigma-K factor RskA
MSAPREPKDDRLEELLMKGATMGLTKAEANEVVVRGGAYDESYAVAAAALDLATLRVEAMPASVEARLLSRLDSASGSAGAAPASGEVAARGQVRPLRRDWARWTGWLAAAAMVALLLGTWLRGGASLFPVVTVTAAEERARLLGSAKDARVLPWTTTKDAAAEHATGDVVWSQAEQKGFMRFQGLATNDKTKTQYQLWIFDKTQDYPVDGGVFDATPNGKDGEIVVPIHSKLHVGTPTLFAVTVEKPGGVVVSKRERIVVTAKAEAG